MSQIKDLEDEAKVLRRKINDNIEFLSDEAFFRLNKRYEEVMETLRILKK